MKKVITTTILTLSLFTLFGSLANASIIRLDPTFGGGAGFIIHDGAAGGVGNDNVESVVNLSDGRYVLVGDSASLSNGQDVSVWRFNADGTIDTTFNSIGYNTFNFAPENTHDIGRSVRLLEDEKYLVAGVARNYDLALFRFNADGTLDTTFDSDGYVTHDNAAGGGQDDAAHATIVQSDGKYVIAGLSDNAPGHNGDMVVWRFNTDGALDETFGDGSCNNGVEPGSDMGCSVYDVNLGGVDIEYATSVSIQQDAKIVISGLLFTISGAQDLVIWRYNSDGTMDDTFGDGSCINGVGLGSSMGCVIHDNAAGGNANDRANDGLIQHDGKYLVTGRSDNPSGNYDMVLWRFNSDGTFDSTFGDGTCLNGVGAGMGCTVFDTTATIYQKSTGESVKQLPDGRIIVAGQGLDASGVYDLMVWGYTSDGVLDTNINSTGYVTHDEANGPGSCEMANSLVIDVDDKYVVGGTSYDSGFESDAVLWRFESLYQIANLQSGLSAEVNATNIELGAPDGVRGLYVINVNQGNVRIFDVYSGMTIDRDWSGVSADSSLMEYKSFASGLVGAPGAASTFSLYIPKRDEDEGVGICPVATSLNDVYDQCQDIYYLSSDDSNVSELTVDDINYWKVDGLTGTGGFSVTELPETGSSISMLYVVGVMLVAVYSIRQRRLPACRGDSPMANIV